MTELVNFARFGCWIIIKKVTCITISAQDHYGLGLQMQHSVVECEYLTVGLFVSLWCNPTLV